MDNTRVLKRACLFPPEGLAGGEGEGQGQLRLGQAERHPLGGDRGFDFCGDGSGGFGGGKRWCRRWGAPGPLHDREGAGSQGDHANSGHELEPFLGSAAPSGA